MNNKILVYIVIIFIIFCIISKKVSNLQENYYAPITKSTSNFKYNPHRQLLSCDTAQVETMYLSCPIGGLPLWV